MPRHVRDTRPALTVPAIQPVTAAPSFVPPRAQGGLAMRPPDLTPERKGTRDAEVPLLKASGLPAVGGPLVLQRKFAGPDFKKGAGDPGPFPGHGLTFPGGVRANTSCGVRNILKTDGSKYDAAAQSDPGDPTSMDNYRTVKVKGMRVPPYSRTGGLVKDKKRNQASIRMHLINHHFDTTNGAAGTQQNAGNILLGTDASNKYHCKQVETPIKKAILAHRSKKNQLYQNEMAAATKTTDNATKNDKVLFWAKAAKPDNQAVRHVQLQNVWLQNNQATDGVAGAKNNATDVEGYAITVDANTPGQHYRHLWLEYQVSANYGNAPAFVTTNINHETAQNTDGGGLPIDAGIAAHIVAFTNPWSDNAFPPDFDCSVDYYSATYDPWNGIYHKESENQNIPTDK